MPEPGLRRPGCLSASGDGDRGVQRLPPPAHRLRVDRARPAAGPYRAAHVEPVQPGGLERGQVLQQQPAAHQQPRLVPGFAAACGLRAQHVQSRADARRGAGRQIGVEAGEPGELEPDRIAVGGPVDGPVEGPPAPGDHLQQRAQGAEVGPAARVEEAEHELLGAFRAQAARRLAQRVEVAPLARAESVRQPQHHAERDVDGAADRAEHGAGRGEAVRGHIGDQFEAVGAAVLGRDGIGRAERDHLEDWSRHMRKSATPALCMRGRPSSAPGFRPGTRPPPWGLGLPATEHGSIRGAGGERTPQGARRGRDVRRRVIPGTGKGGNPEARV